MTETVTGHQLGVYILERKIRKQLGFGYDIDKYGIEDFVEFTQVLGVFTTLDNLKLAKKRVIQYDTKINKKDITYRLVPKDELLIDLPSITENVDDVYDF